MASAVTGSTYRAAHGRWREVLVALGFPEGALAKRQQPCPMCGGTDRFLFTDRSGEGDYICRQCGAGKGFKLLMAWSGWDFRKAAQEVDAVIGNLPSTKPVQIRNARAASMKELGRLWASAEFLTAKTVAGQYLATRGLEPVPRQPALRCASRLMHYPSKQELPCMLAWFSDAEGKPRQIHRTYLTKEGRKADVEPNRMFTPGPLPKGGAIRLGVPEAFQPLGIAEGIETALAAAQLHGMAVWATTLEGMLRAWQPPEYAHHVVIFGDSDPNYVGQHAAYELARRLVHQGLRVEVLIPPALSMDWNDVLVAQRKQ